MCSWIAEEVGETFEGAAIDGFYIIYRILRMNTTYFTGFFRIKSKFNEVYVEDSLLTKGTLIHDRENYDYDSNFVVFVLMISRLFL